MRYLVAMGRFGGFLRASCVPDGPDRRPWQVEPAPSASVSLATANALTMLRRVVWHGEADEATKALTALLRWAATGANGQPAALLGAAAERRRAAVQALCEQGATAVLLRVRPRWRLIVGLGASDTPHETSIALHGTYGIPVLPGSALKGVAARRASPAELAAIFGGPRPGERPRRRPRRGGVMFLDALPERPVAVVHDVMTPHAGKYYQDGEPPAEYWEPIPVDLLTVGDGEFLIHLVGRDAAQVERAADLLADALDELGLGAKTAAGYGYLKTVERAVSPGDR